MGAINTVCTNCYSESSINWYLVQEGNPTCSKCYIFYKWTAERRIIPNVNERMRGVPIHTTWLTFIDRDSSNTTTTSNNRSSSPDTQIKFLSTILANDYRSPSIISISDDDDEEEYRTPRKKPKIIADPNAPPKKKRGRPKAPTPEKCTNCGAKQTQQWHGPQTPTPICHSCYEYKRKHGHLP